jgi:hypothetical protein
VTGLLPMPNHGVVGVRIVPRNDNVAQ